MYTYIYIYIFFLFSYKYQMVFKVCKYFPFVNAEVPTPYICIAQLIPKGHLCWKEWTAPFFALQFRRVFFLLSCWKLFMAAKRQACCCSFSYNSFYHEIMMFFLFVMLLNFPAFALMLGCMFAVLHCILGSSFSWSQPYLS